MINNLSLESLNKIRIRSISIRINGFQESLFLILFTIFFLIFFLIFLFSVSHPWFLILSIFIGTNKTWILCNFIIILLCHGSRFFSNRFLDRFLFWENLIPNIFIITGGIRFLIGSLIFDLNIFLILILLFSFLFLFSVIDLIILMNSFFKGLLSVW